MGQRYLTRRNAENTLQRGRRIECFLGECARDGVRGIEHVSIGLRGGTIELYVFKTTDRGNAEFLDLYEFGPLNTSLTHGEADEILSFGSLDECLTAMDSRWPGSAMRLVNEGVLQDEYRDYLERRPG